MVHAWYICRTINKIPMTKENFRLDKQTLKEVKTILKLLPMDMKKSQFYREAVKEKLAREKNTLQRLEKAFNKI